MDELLECVHELSLPAQCEPGAHTQRMLMFLAPATHCVESPPRQTSCSSQRTQVMLPSEEY
jgi:hypothetical protein